MAVKTSVKTGKATEAATWSNGKAVEAGDDIVLANGFNVTWDTTLQPRSLIAETGATFTSVATKGLKLGASTVREVEGKNVLLKISSGATWSFTETIQFASTSATTAGVWMGGKSLGSKKLNFIESGHYRLEEAVTGEAASLIEARNTATLETNGQELAVGFLRVEGTANVTLGASLLKLAGAAGEVFGCVAGATLSAASSTIELTDTSVGEKEFFGGGKTYGTVVIAGFVKVAGANTFSTLQVNTKGAAAGKGVRLTKTVKQTVTTLTSNGTEAEPALLESTEAGKPAELEITEQETTGWLHLKDVTVLKGVWYLPHGKDEGGNKIVKPTAEFTVAFEAKPSTGVTGKATGAILLTGTATATVRNVVSGKATGPLLLTGTAAGTVRAVVTGKAAGPLLLTGTAAGIVRSVVTGKATGPLLLTGTAGATLRSVVTGKATGEILFTGTAQATTRAVVTGKASGVLLLAGRARSTNATSTKKILIFLIDE